MAQAAALRQQAAWRARTNAVRALNLLFDDGGPVQLQPRADRVRRRLDGAQKKHDDWNAVQDDVISRLPPGDEQEVAVQEQVAAAEELDIASDRAYDYLTEDDPVQPDAAAAEQEKARLLNSYL